MDLVRDVDMERGEMTPVEGCQYMCIVVVQNSCMHACIYTSQFIYEQASIIR